MATLHLDGTTEPDSEPIYDDKLQQPNDDIDRYDVVVLDTVHASEGEFTEEQYRKLLRKIDWILLPLMWLAYGPQQADKTGTSTQATFGLRTDTGLIGQQYAFLSTGFYIAYLVGEFPANVLLQKLPVGKTLSVFMFSWGLIVLCIAFCTNFTQLMSLRVLQGLTECIISPAFLYITGAWYRSSEHAMRSIVWGTANAGFAIIAGLIEYGIGTAAQNAGNVNTAWKPISYFLGGSTMLVSIPVYFILGTPREVRWLSEKEQRMAIARVVANQTGSDRFARKEFDWKQARQALIDPQTWFIFFAVFVGSLPNGGTTTFVNIVYTSFGFTPLDTLLKGTVPQNLFSVVWFLVVGYVTMMKKGLRFYFMIFSLIPGSVGLLALGLLPTSPNYLWLKWGMFFISIMANVTGLMIWTFVPSNIAGRTKKTVTSAILFAAYCSGNAVGAQIFQASDAPLYLRALTVCAVMFAVEIVILTFWRLYYVVINRRRDRQVAEWGMTREEAEHQGKLNAEAGMTDWENVHFRYTM